jgi:plastocyanin
MFKCTQSVGVAVAGAVVLALVAAGCAGNNAGEGRTAPVQAQAQAHPAGNATESQHLPKSTPEPENVPNQVAIDNFRFSPSELTVAVGTKVTWVNHDDVPHTATSTTKPRVIDSGTLDTDDKFSYVFTAPGTYEYFCAVHPHMKGRIVVK